jgi:transposase-like protein
MMTQQRQKYDREFKRKAVELSFARGNAKEIAEELYTILCEVVTHPYFSLNT